MTTRTIQWITDDGAYPVAGIIGPPGPGGGGGSAFTGAVQASEAIAGGAFVNVYSNPARVRLADASDPAKFANGFCTSAIPSGSAGAVTFGGLNSTITVAVSAPQVWLSDSVPGGFTTTPPSASGSLVQSLGPAIAGVGVAFTSQPGIVL